MTYVLGIHVLFSSLALVFGAAALTFKKGGCRHRKSGQGFVLTMLVMGLSAVWLAASAGVWLDVLSGLLVCYLVGTSWLTMQRQNKGLALVLVPLAVVLICGYLWVEWQAFESGEKRPGVPTGVGLVFATVVGLALLGDCRQLFGRVLIARQRLVRHLWRMCFALFMATVSFFMSRAHLFPQAVQDSGVLILLGIAPMLLLLFWVLWVRRQKVVAAIVAQPKKAA